MSKVDAMRALREARMTAQAKAAPAATPVRRSTQAKAPARMATTEVTPEADGEACGHRNMGGKSCTRPAGHSEKNHRYS